MAKMYEIDCDPTCGSMVRSHNKGEVIRFAIGHVKSSHHQKLTKSEAESKIKVI